MTKTGLEVDFIVRKGEEIIPIEVKLAAEPDKVERGLRGFIDVYKPKLAVVVFHEGKYGEIRINGCKVVFTDIPGMIDLLKK